MPNETPDELKAAKTQTLMRLAKSGLFNPQTDDPENLTGQNPSSKDIINQMFHPTPAPQAVTPVAPVATPQPVTNTPTTQPLAPQTAQATPQPQMSDAIANALTNPDKDNQLKGLFPSGQ